MERLSAALNLQPDFFLRPFPYDEAVPLYFRSLASATKGARMRAAERHKWLGELTSYVEQFVQLPPVLIPVPEPAPNWPTLEPGQVEEIATFVRRAWGFGDGAISDVTMLLENHGVVVSSTGMWSEALEAFSGWLDHRPFIVIEGVSASAARSRMSLCHELGHLVLHRDVPIAVLDDKQTFKQVEAQAWRFASAFLLPEEAFRADVRWPTLETFRILKPKWKVSIQAMLNRARDLGMVTPEAEQAMWRSLTRRGWRAVEPLDEELLPERPGLLRDAIRLMIESRVITVNQLVDDTALSESDLRDLVGLDDDFFAPPLQRLRLLPLPPRESSSQRTGITGPKRTGIPVPGGHADAPLNQAFGEQKGGDSNVVKYNRNSGKPWTSGNVKELRSLAKENTPTRVIGLKLGRTEDAVRTKASEENVSLKPTNQSPYNRQK